MFQKVQEAVALLNQEYLQGFSVTEGTRTQDLQKICRFLEQSCKEQHTVFVHGRGKRKSRNQKYLELFQRFLERQTIYDWHTASFRGRNNYCKTDPDATFMHMKDDHMRNAQLKRDITYRSQWTANILSRQIFFRIGMMYGRWSLF